MFDKILIANRGEIACRVIKTARKMGIKTVAIYSDADKHALHVEMADEAVHIGPPPASQNPISSSTRSWSRSCKEIGRAGGASGLWVPVGKPQVRTGAGGRQRYGVHRHRRSRPIEAMGDKIDLEEAGRRTPAVNTVPGYLGLIEDADGSGEDLERDRLSGDDQGQRRRRWQGHADRLGRRGSPPRASSHPRTRRPTASAMTAIFIEKFVTQPRHIEIQVLGDGAWQRDLPERARMLASSAATRRLSKKRRRRFWTRRPARRWANKSVALAKAVGYASAGTVEFIVDGDRNFYFLEMNTRLQVEHPVTELITGVDLVEQMIRVAGGEPLSITQDDVKINGWAIESRALRRRPLSRVPALDWPSDALSSARRRGAWRRDRAQRHGRVRRRRDLACITTR